MNEVFISVIEKHINKLKNNIKQKQDYAFCQIIRSFFAENNLISDNVYKLIIREPNHCNKNQCRRYAHKQYVRPVFTRFTSGVINN